MKIPANEINRIRWAEKNLPPGEEITITGIQDYILNSRPMKILITGSLGFIFSHVTEHFLSRGHEVWGIDALYDGSHPKLEDEFIGKYPKTYRQYKLDIVDMPGEFKVFSPMSSDLRLNPIEEPVFDVIIHAAAESNVDKSLGDKMSFLRSNIQGTYAMLEYAIKNKPELFLYINTDEVYGSVTSRSEEWDAPNPGNPYSASKQAAANLCYAYRNTYDLNVREVRMCNIIGPRQATTKLIPRVIDCIKNDLELPIYDGGTATREYADCRDIGPMLERVINKGGWINNITFNQELSTIGVVDVISKIMGKSPRTIASHRAGHDFHYSMQRSQVCDGYNFIKFEDSIEFILRQ